MIHFGILFKLFLFLEGWRDSVTILSGVARQRPQTTYAGMQKSLQHEWAFVQRVTPYIWMAFQAVDNELLVSFLLDLFQGSTSQIPERSITVLLVKQAGIILPEPTCTAGANWTAS